MVETEIKTQFRQRTLIKIVGRTRPQDCIKEPIQMKVGMSATHVVHTIDLDSRDKDRINSLATDLHKRIYWPTVQS